MFRGKLLMKVSFSEIATVHKSAPKESSSSSSEEDDVKPKKEEQHPQHEAHNH